MTLSQNKHKAIAKLKNGEAVYDIAIELEISPALVQEWADDLSPDEMEAKEINAIAINKATQLIDNYSDETDADKLQKALTSVAIAITDELKNSVHDIELATSLNKSANTVAVLHSAFFGKGANIAVISTNNHNNNELSTFRGSLRS